MKITKVLSSIGLSAIVLFALITFTSKSSFAQGCCDGGSCCGTEKSCCSDNTAGGIKKDSTKKEVPVKVNGLESSSVQTVDPVTGESIDESSAINFEYLGTNYKFANDASLAKFKAEPFDYVKNLECPVMGDAAAKENGVMVEGTKYYLCCSSCEKAFKKNPDKYIKKDKKENTK